MPFSKNIFLLNFHSGNYLHLSLRSFEHVASVKESILQPHEVGCFFVGLAKERECPIIEVSFFKPWSATRMSHNRCFVFGRVEHNPSEAHWNDLRQFDNRSGFSFLHVPPNRHFLSLNPFVSECFETLNNVEILAARNQNFLKSLNQINLLVSLVLVRCTYTAMYINGNDRNIMFLGTLFVEKR